MKKNLFSISICVIAIGVVSAQTLVAGTTVVDSVTNHLSIDSEMPNTIHLFNGTNLDGFTFCMKNDADPTKTWSVENGVIHCNGSTTGYMRTKQSFTNYVLVVEWRFKKVEPKKDNTGVLVHMQLPDKVWPVCIQNQGKSGRQGDLFVMGGAECKEHLALGKDANTPVAFTGPSAENPVGEWNTNITTCGEMSGPPGYEGPCIDALINPIKTMDANMFKIMNEISQCTVSNGFVGIQSEGADFEIRKMNLTPRPALVTTPERHGTGAMLEPKFWPPNSPLNNYLSPK